MGQTVYIDLYFLINFSMDFLCFFLVCALLSYSFCIPRGLAAAAFGGAYACVALVLGAGGIWGLVLDAAACILMSIIAVKKKGNWRQTATFALVYAAASILMGGFMTVLFSLFNKIGLDELFGNEGTSDGISVWLFAVLAIISGLLSVLGGKFFRKKSARREGKVKIKFGNNQIVLGTLCDSGNLLREPISGKLCVVVDKTKLDRILPTAIKEVISGASADILNSEYSERLRVVPAMSVNGESLLYALRADSLSVNMGKGWCELDAFVVLGELKGAEGIFSLVPSELIAGVP